MRRMISFGTLALATACVFAALFYSANPVAKGAESYAAKVSAASAATYVSLRTLNAFLSTAQEVEVGGGAVVVQGTMQPLKFLEPVDDTVERIAGLVFALMILSGLLAVSSGPVSGVGFGMAGIGLILLSRFPRLRVGRKLAVYGVFFALALPLSYVFSGILSDTMTQSVWEQNSAVVKEITSGIEQGDQNATEESGFWASVSGGADAVKRYTEMSGKILSRADDLIASYIRLLGVLLFNLVLLPVLLAGGFFILFRWFVNEVDR